MISFVLRKYFDHLRAFLLEFRYIYNGAYTVGQVATLDPSVRSPDALS